MINCINYLRNVLIINAINVAKDISNKLGVIYKITKLQNIFKYIFIINNIK
jgi:hypothetical protein